MPNDKLRRQPAWISGGIVLALTVIAAAILGFLMGARAWQLYLGLAAVLLLLAGSMERLFQRRRSRASTPASRLRGKLKVIRGGKAYDLEKDDTTDSQRYLM